MDTPNPNRDLHGWLSFLTGTRLPILGRSHQALQFLQGRMETLSARHLSEIILRDPLLALQVILYLQQHQNRARNHDITTVGQALLMLGMQPFFRHFLAFPTAESLFANHPDGLQGALQVISRSYHAALYAHCLADLRHDMDSEEVMLAALLHDIAEVLLWCFSPTQMQQIENVLLANPGLRSAEAQQQLLGFTVNQLQHELIVVWKLPALLQTLMNEAKPDNQRTLCTVAAVDLARHSAHGWDDPALPHDMDVLTHGLHMEAEQLWPHLRDTALKAAKEWKWYGIRPPAAALVNC